MLPLTHTQVMLIERAFEKVFDPEIYQDYTYEYYDCQLFIRFMEMISENDPYVDLNRVITRDKASTERMIGVVRESIKILPKEYADEKALITLMCNNICRKIGVMHLCPSSFEETELHSIPRISGCLSVVA